MSGGVVQLSLAYQGRAKPISFTAIAVAKNGTGDLDGASIIEGVAFGGLGTLQFRFKARGGRADSKRPAVLLATSLADQARTVKDEVETACVAIVVRNHFGEVGARIRGRVDDARRIVVVPSWQIVAVVVVRHMGCTGCSALHGVQVELRVVKRSANVAVGGAIVLQHACAVPHRPHALAVLERTVQHCRPLQQQQGCSRDVATGAASGCVQAITHRRMCKYSPRPTRMCTTPGCLILLA